jgi:hypothetical protein
MFGAASGKKLKATPNNASVNATSVGGAPVASQPSIMSTIEKNEKDGSTINSGNAIKESSSSGLP